MTDEFEKILSALSTERIAAIIESLEAERDYFKSLCDSFFLGEIPKSGATMQHFVLRQWGERRIEEKSRQAALLSAPKS